jgi:hypothetical protein
LAVKALPVDAARPFERWGWIGVFVFLLLIGIVLAFVQQVRLTNAQTLADDRERQKDLRSEGAVKYTQGQLDSINKVLAQVASSPSGLDKSLNSALLQGALRASQSVKPNVEPPAIQRMTSLQLRSRVIDFSNQLRDISMRMQTQSRQLQDEMMNASRSAPNDDERKKRWNDYSTKTTNLYLSHAQQIQSCCIVTATEYRDELLRRLGPDNPSDKEKFPFTFWLSGSSVVGNPNEMTLDQTAAYLEYMARRLN